MGVRNESKSLDTVVKPRYDV
ncbi:palindromic element RPE4 domain-containing protein [Kangiella sp.]|nr:palindromic element RPE4 domain-containing protein [Kangiella sp.]